MIKEFLQLIDKYNNISIFRHEFPDPDALGSQFGLKTLIEDNYPTKNVKVLGLPIKTLNSHLYPEMDQVDDEFIESSLAIVLDSANSERIDDKRYRLSKKIIKIDHHPALDNYGDLNIVDVKVAATSILLARISLENKWQISALAATFLYSGIVGDTGRFLHNNTSAEVFDYAKILLEHGADISNVYEKLYTTSVNEMRLIGYIQQHFKIYQDKIAYYYLTEPDYHQFSVDFEKAKDYVYVIANIENIKIWLSATFNPNTKYYHISIRSNKIEIDDVAKKFGGGGHKYAVGVKVSTIARLFLIIKELSKKISC